MLVAKPFPLPSAPPHPLPARDSRGTLWHENTYARFWFRFTLTMTVAALSLLPILILTTSQGPFATLYQMLSVTIGLALVLGIPILWRLSDIQRVGVGTAALFVEARRWQREIPWSSIAAIERTHAGNSLRLVLIDGQPLRLRGMGKTLNRTVEEAFAQARAR